jgi:hypothetical protein
MKKVSLIKYRLAGVPVTRKTLIHRALYGYVDHSNKGTYSYKRKGALNGLEYTKLGSGIIIIDTKHVDKLIPLFKKYKIKTRILDMAML